MSKLKIYKASAGSGKTYKLTEEYLRLLFHNPNNFKRILAVTFTNKATEEMKSRIVSELYKLSVGEQNTYFKTFTNEFNWDNEKIKQQAGIVLNNILHDYSKFSVGTIDSFFQKVIRAFSKELGLYSGYTIELDNSGILGEAVDNIFTKIDEEKQTREWLLKFSEDKIKDGKSWNLKQDILKLSYEIFKEQFLSLSDEIIAKINDKSFLNKYYADLYKIKSGFENDLKAIANRAIEQMELYSLEVDDFSGKKGGVAGHFYKILNNKFEKPTKTAINAQNNVEKWYTKTSDNKDAIIEAVNGGLNDILVEAIEYYNVNSSSYNSVDKITGLFYSLGIIVDIATEVKKITGENNIFLLSDAAKFLHSIINDDDTPFVYEKMGYFFKHFMIDEFQDTSNLQWSDFKPLILNSLSENNSSLVVGDIKQSIYRWRNSDWKLLAEQVDSDFRNQGTEHVNLKQNWRSKKNIISYNNAVFKKASEILQQQFNEQAVDYSDNEIEILRERIENAYSEVLQISPESTDNKGGLIKNIFIESENWQDEVLMKLPETVEKIQEKGYRAKDIAILVRKHQEGKMVADTFLNYKNSKDEKPECNYNIISGESLYISSSMVVNFLVSLLKYFITPNDDIVKAYIISSYNSFENKNEEIDYNELFIETLHNKFLEVLPKSFSENISNLKKLPLYELVIQLIDIFLLNKKNNELPYLLAFQDLVSEFTRNDSTDLNSFLNWWDEEGISKTINIPDDSDAIRIITIHKSKGLEFDVVIVPFCDWQIDPSRPSKIIWCKPEQEPFNQIKLLPVEYSTSLKDTIFYKDYFNEKINTYIDNLNMLYVSFTRAKNVLISFSPYKTNDSIKTVSDILLKIIDTKTEDDFKLNDFWDTENRILIIDKENAEPVKEQDNIENKIISGYNIVDYRERLKLKFSGNKFFNNEDTKKSRTNKGTILHRIFEHINTVNDINKAIEITVFEGLISEEEAKHYKAIIEKALLNPAVKDWFSGKYKIFQERAIILPNGHLKRPDRIMILGNDVVIVDYKFGEEMHEHYIKQVREYSDIVKKMGYVPKAFIWYVLLNKIVEV